MKISDGAKEKLIKHFEGIKLVAYPDPGSGKEPWTIGYGHTKGVKKGMRCTEDEANAFLDEDIKVFEDAVKKLVAVPLSQSQFDALVSFIFNVGETKFKSSTLLAMLNQGLPKKAALEFNKWKYAAGKVMAGLVKRRQAETNWFNTGSTDGTN